MREFDADVVIVGSGFGGSVATLRAAQSGQARHRSRTGPKADPEDLDRGAERTRSLLWEPALGLTGYFRQTVLQDVVVVGGVGVGGGSIVYAAVLLEPTQEAFPSPRVAKLNCGLAHQLARTIARRPPCWAVR